MKFEQKTPKTHETDSKNLQNVRAQKHRFTSDLLKKKHARTPHFDKENQL